MNYYSVDDCSILSTSLFALLYLNRHSARNHIIFLRDRQVCGGVYEGHTLQTQSIHVEQLGQI